MGVLVSSERLKSMHQIVIYILSGGTRSPVTLIMNCLSLSLGIQGRLFLKKKKKKNKKWETQGFLYPGRLHRVLLGFTTELTISYFLNIHMFLFIQHYFFLNAVFTRHHASILSLQTL